MLSILIVTLCEFCNNYCNDKSENCRQNAGGGIDLTVTQISITSVTIGIVGFKGARTLIVILCPTRALKYKVGKKIDNFW